MQSVQLTYKKEGICAYISHLDIVRAFARAFSRADLPIKYSGGFNPIAYLVFSQPLSLGYESLCDICEFSLTEDVPDEEIVQRLGAVMPTGISVLSSKAPEHSIGKITFASYSLYVDTEMEINDKILNSLRDIFQQKELFIMKKSKRLEKEVNILPLIKNIEFERIGEKSFKIHCILANGNQENLNPDYLIKVIERELPPIQINYVKTVREEFFLEDLTKF